MLLSVRAIVINELEGLSKGIKQDAATGPTGIITSKLTSSVSVLPVKPTTSSLDRRYDPKHAEMVATASKQALRFIKQKNPALK